MLEFVGDLKRLHHCRALFEKVTEMVATEVKAPRGSINEVCVCVCVHQSQDDNQVLIFWALLVQFGLGIVCQE